MSNNETLSEEELKKIYAQADKLLDKHRAINLEDESILDEEDKYKSDFYGYLKKDEYLFKILILLLHAPMGLKKNDIALYLKDGKYETKTDKNGKELTPEDQIKKNVNNMDSNVAHLNALLYMFFPDHRDALEIKKEKPRSKENSFRYKFNDYEKAQKLFPSLCGLDSSFASPIIITAKERKEIAEICIKEIVSSVDTSEISEDKTRKNILSLCKAIKAKSLCQIQKSSDKDEKLFFLPIMLRDVTENQFDDFYYDVIPGSYSKDDLLNKYIECTSRVYYVFGLLFESDFCGEKIEWYRKSKKCYFDLTSITNIKVLGKNKLSEQGLMNSEDYRDLTRGIYKMNPYNNLCGEDFYLLLPKSFYDTIHHSIRAKVFSSDWTESDKNANNFISSIDYLNPLSRANKPLWKIGAAERFNLDYYQPLEDYRLVECKNYVELLELFNSHHLILPKETLPRELVDKQYSQFVKSLISKDMVASPHYISQKEIALSLEHGHLYDSSIVFNQSNVFYEQSKADEYVSKFGYRDISLFTDREFNIFEFCRDICKIDLKDEQHSFRIGIPLCISEEKHTNYLVYLEYPRLEKLLNENEKDKLNLKDLFEPEIRKINELIYNNYIDQDVLFEKLSEEMDLSLSYVPLSEVNSVIYLSEKQITSTSESIYYLALNNEAEYCLQVVTEKVLKPNARLDDLTEISRDYCIFFENKGTRRDMYIPDTFKCVKLFKGFGEFSKERIIPAAVSDMMHLTGEPLNEGIDQDIWFITFITHKRSEVIRFLHENMGRVSYLDMSEDSSDPLGIYEELKNDNQKLMAGFESTWQSVTNNLKNP